jgi:nucleoside 2-deoxyribosyltransferase
MSHGDIVTLTKDGIVAHEKSFRSIGIYDQSVCFGMWVGNPYKEFDCDGNELPPQLIVSPFHPFSWASMLRIRILLNNSKGNLHKITKLLSDNHLSILYTECMPSGFGNATWHVVAESTKKKVEELKRKKEAFDREHSHIRTTYGGGKDCESCKNEPDFKVFEEARSLANEFAFQMLIHSGEIRLALKNLEKAEKEIKRIKRFLKGEKVTIYEELYEKGEIKNQKLVGAKFKNEEKTLSLSDLLNRLNNIENGKHLRAFLDECIKLKIFLKTEISVNENNSKINISDLNKLENDFNKLYESLNELEEIKKLKKGVKEKLDEITPTLHDWEAFEDLPDQHFLFNTRKVLKKMRENKKDWNDRGDSYFYRGAYRPIFRVRYQMDMAFFAIYGGGKDVPILLKYDAKRLLLKPYDEQVFVDNEWKDVLNVPIQFIANFDTQSKFIKLIPITKPVIKTKLTNIDISYKVTATKGQVAEKSKGLLSSVCELLKNININLMHNTNKNTRFEYNSEIGKMSFTADLDYNNSSEVEKLRAILTTIPQDKYVSIRKIKIFPQPTKKLFLSLHFGHPRDEQIREIVKNVASERGFEAAIVETHVEPVTEKVEAQIKSCDALLQILTFREHENPTATHFNWLDFEYGVAFGVSIPTLRLVDVVRLSFEEWEQKNNINKDQRCHEFRTDVSDEQLACYIRTAIEELDRKLLKKEINR